MTPTAQLVLGGEPERYEALIALSEALSVNREPKELPGVLADRLNALIHFDHLEVLVFREDSSEVEWRVAGKGEVVETDLPIEERATWGVFQTQQPLLISDCRRDHRFEGLREWLNRSAVEVGSLLCVPLTTAHRRLGVLALASARPCAYDREDVRYLSLLARVVALAVDDTLNFRKSEAARSELERQNAKLAVLLDLTNRITSNLDLRELLREILAIIRQMMECDLAVVSLPEPETGKFRVYALDFPEGNGLIHEDQMHPPDCPADRAWATLKPVVVHQPISAGLHPGAYRLVQEEGIKSFCHVPLVSRGRALGILTLGRSAERSFSQDDLQSLTQFASQVAIAVENARAYRQIADLKDKLAQEKLYLEEEIRSELNFEQIIGNSPALRHVLKLVETVAPSDSTVLLLGETGTGKELIARALHQRSRRTDRTFVKLNCAAIPTGLLESELFGHERGAFTGAISQKVGRLELADKGTLFLDEVGDIPNEIQPKLLRVLQEREFERLGSAQTRRVDVRLIAATNRDLEKMVAAREFRSDLFYRLNVFPIHIPPLRERREDIPLLVRYFVQQFATRTQKHIESIPAAALKKLAAWDWPGNIRELENFIERAVILTRGKALEVPTAELMKSKAVSSSGRAGSQGQEQIARIVRETISELNQEANGSAARDRDRRRRDEIERVLEETKGRVGGAGGAAARLGVSRTTLLYRMKRLGVDPKDFS